ncbi:hypothetical protein VMCG_10191 [Cytospora schulzeri]|uniref:Uncharacterized protein n=1 Tax=Cytospora schulzeri TaxID=448051 RepID=A0A423VD10_9PEZI|nr:hypothetical protein VMCG_10191 [Valsa malicola]
MVDDLPIAIRRTRRNSVASHANSGETHNTNTNTKQPLKPLKGPKSEPLLFTPSRGSKKRVRFSDPGKSTSTEQVEVDVDDDAKQDNLAASSSSSTGLTPHIRRTTLDPESANKRRRHSGSSSASGGGRSDAAFDSTIDTMHTGEVTFLPLRQVLDGRVKRRIRRNGLSEEINLISAEKKKKAQQTKEEIAALRAEVAARDAEIRRLSGATVVSEEDEASIDDLKRQVAQVRRSLKSPESSDGTEDTIEYDTSRDDWLKVSRDPFSGEHSDMDVDSDFDDSDFGDTTLAELACSTPSRRSSDIRNSFPTPPSTSPPPGPLTPSRRRHQVVSPTKHAIVQTSFTDGDKEELEEELASLHLEVAKLTNTLEGYEAMTTRLSEKLHPFAPKDGSAAALIMDTRSPTVRVEAQLNNLLQAFSDRTACLAGVFTSLDDLGFPGGDANEIITSLSSAFREARLELEYLTPGEITIPLTAAGSSVLDLLLTRLRELARRSLECEDAVDEYHALEVSLRRQLGARADAMDGMRTEMRNLQRQSRGKDARVRELEAGVERLKGSVKSYTRDVSELEGLVQRLEADLDTANKGLRRAEEDNQADLEEWTDALEGKDSTIAMLEEKLGLALEQTSELKDQLDSLQNQQRQMGASHEEELTSMTRRHGAALALRDERVEELRLEIDRVNEALRGAHETIQALRAENSSLSGRVDSEKAKAKAAIDTMRSELERVVRMGQDLVGTPKRTTRRG